MKGGLKTLISLCVCATPLLDGFTSPCLLLLAGFFESIHAGSILSPVLPRARAPLAPQPFAGTGTEQPPLPHLPVTLVRLTNDVFTPALEVQRRPL